MKNRAKPTAPPWGGAQKSVDAAVTSFPDILQQLVAGGVIFFLALFLLIQTLTHLFASPAKTKNSDPHQELCLHCGYDTRGLIQCPECGKPTREAHRQRLAKLREAWPTEAISIRVPASTEHPVTILNTGERMAARLLQQHLEARGIAARVEAVQTPAVAAYVPSAASYRINVWSEDQERASVIVEHLWHKEARVLESP